MFENVISVTGPKVRPEAVAASGSFLTGRVLAKIIPFLKGLSLKSSTFYCSDCYLKTITVLTDHESLIHTPPCRIRIE